MQAARKGRELGDTAYISGMEIKGTRKTRMLLLEERAAHRQQQQRKLSSRNKRSEAHEDRMVESYIKLAEEPTVVLLEMSSLTPQSQFR